MFLQSFDAYGADESFVLLWVFADALWGAASAQEMSLLETHTAYCGAAAISIHLVAVVAVPGASSVKRGPVHSLDYWLW